MSRLARFRSALSLSVVLVAAGSASAGLVDVVATSLADGSTLIDGRSELGAGESRRFVRRGVHLSPGGDELSILIEVSLVEETALGARLAVNAFVRPAAGGAAIEWTARTLTLARGESSRFGGQPAGMVEFTLAFEPDDVPAGDRLHLATTISVSRLRPEGPELVQSQRVRLVGSRDTEVILATPDGGDVLLVVRVRPRARDEDGAVLELGIESAGPDGAGATVRETWVELSWDDVVRIAGFRAQADELLIEIKPER